MVSRIGHGNRCRLGGVKPDSQLGSLPRDLVPPWERVTPAHGSVDKASGIEVVGFHRPGSLVREGCGPSFDALAAIAYGRYVEVCTKIVAVGPCFCPCRNRAGFGPAQADGAASV
jgi:hypothetical protein